MAGAIRSFGTELAIPEEMTSHLTHVERPGSRGTTLSAAAPRAPLRDERQRVVDWLDAGLRQGQCGALEAEYPLSMGSGGSQIHRVIFEGTRPIAHAMLHPTALLARGRRLPVGLIGNVYTDPAYRGRGLSRACIEACSAEAERRSLALVLLWSELDAFYQRLGFTRAGRETYLALDRDGIARASGTFPEQALGRSSEGRRVSAATAADYPSLDRLYAALPIRSDRPAGSLARFAQAPGTQIVVDRGSNGVRAYAAMGRGADFPGVVHEWAGDSAGVLACLSELCRSRDSLLMLAGPEPAISPVAMQLQREAAAAHSVPFALVRLVDVETFWNAMAPENSRIALRAGDASQRSVSIQWKEPHALNARPLGDPAPADRARISAEAAIRMLVDGEMPAGLPSQLDAALRDELRASAPWPLYLWGFDSI